MGHCIKGAYSAIFGDSTFRLTNFFPMLTIHFDQFPVIETARLLLREPSPDDAPDLFRLRTDDMVMKYLARIKPKDLDEVALYINTLRSNFAQSLGVNWIISPKESGKAIGTIGFWRIDNANHRAEIGYLLDPLFQGRGIATEAMHAVLQYGFDQLKFHSVEANVDPQNDASQKLLKRVGFVQEAFFQGKLFF